jgi:hypothetical protein
VYFYDKPISNQVLLEELIARRDVQQIIGYIRLPYSQSNNPKIINLNNEELFTIQL